jgi:hypothetical protein
MPKALDEPTSGSLKEGHIISEKPYHVEAGTVKILSILP